MPNDERQVSKTPRERIKDIGIIGSAVNEGDDSTQKKTTNKITETRTSE
jgi:hypothetical protein